MAWPGSHDDPGAPDVIGAGDAAGGLPGRWPRLRRPAVITAALAAAAVITVAAVLASSGGPSPAARHPARLAGHDQPPVTITSRMPATVAPLAGGLGQAFASGTVSGRKWQLAVADIAGPAGPCQPAVTLNGMDAGLLYPGTPRATPAGDLAFMAPGAPLPGAGFGFAEVPAGTSRVRVGSATGRATLSMRPLTVTSCGQRFRLAGFAYPLTAPLVIHAALPGRTGSLTVPAALSDPRPSLPDPQVSGVWQDTASARARPATLATGVAFGQRWTITVALGTAGDCFTLGTGYRDDSVNARPEVASLCGPVSTPRGPATVMALGIESPAFSDGLGTGYAVSLPPGTTALTAHLSGGGVMTAAPAAVAGRLYAAFFVPGATRLTGLTWAGTSGQQTAAVAGLQQYGYIQLRP